MQKIWILILFFVTIASVNQAQKDVYDEVKNAEMSIPSAPAFAMLGVNPELVMRPSDLKSFKVDWRIKNYNLAPDLALEAQPFWHFYYKKRTFDEYAVASRFAKKLSTLSLSIGTAKIDNINHASYSIKLNLYKKNDVINDTLLLKQLRSEHRNQLQNFNAQIDSLVILRYQTTDPKRKNEIDKELDVIRYEMKNIDEISRLKYRNIIDQYNGENWNNTMLDAAFGSVFTYDNAGIDSLRVKRAGYALWLNGCLKMGDHGLMSGLFRYTRIVDSSNKMFGLNFRYGSQRYNFYAEVVYEILGNYFDPNQELAFDEDEYFAGKYIEDIGSGWLDFNNTKTKTQYTMAYGGDFKLSRNILLNFALRTQFTSDIKLTRLLPVANIICLMK
ncbi:MAG: hypothetical protein KA270_13250 [Saprospiraceae bacterium]|nr:hypothetical protein [Saprospiraceae bacterium]MBP6568131.1 hypothetical protein [Saprospiraceae bacterium]